MSDREDDPGDELPFRQIAQHLQTPCWISDAEGNIIWVNDAWLEYTGKTAEALASEGLRQLHHPEKYRAVAERWLEVKAAGRAAEMEFPLKGRNGEFRPFLTRVVPLRDAQGQVVRWFGTNTDQSLLAEARSRAMQSEEALQENLDRLRLAAQAGGVGVWEWRLLTNEMLYSPEARAICGFSADEPLTYDKVVAVTHPEDFPRTSAQSRRALDPAIRDRTPYDYRIVRPSGEIRQVTAYGEAIFESQPDGSERAVRYVGTLVDVTERKQTEEMLRSSESEMRIALRAGRMATWRIDRSGRLTASPELNTLIGLPADAQPTMEELSAYYLPGEMDRIREASQQAQAREQSHFEIEYRFRRVDGEVRCLYARAEALLSPDGTPDGVSGVVMDITERKSQEERLRVLAQEVDHRANNLLTVALGTVRLSRAETAEALREVIEGRIEALARAHALIAESKWRGADIRRLVLDELRPFRDDHNIVVDGPDLTLSGAAAQSLAMVLHELATNAVKYGALSATGSVEVAWWTSREGGLHLRWVERGGPPVNPPTRTGFGTRVIQRTLSEQLGGQADLSWRETGLECQVYIPPQRFSAGTPL